MDDRLPPSDDHPSDDRVSAGLASRDRGAEPLLRRLDAFITAPSAQPASPTGEAGDHGSTFDALARDVFGLQYRRIEPFRRLADARGVTPDTLGSWREIPPVPVAAFKSLELAAAPAREIFRSSGTTGGEGSRSVHHHPFPDLYRRVVERQFDRHCLLPGESRLPMLSLVAPRRQIADSSLGFMVDHLLTRRGDDAGPGCRVAFGPGGVDFDAADAWARDAERTGRPGIVFATAFALAWWLEELARRRRRHRLPAASRVFETGGFKGRTRELERPELLAGVRRHLGLGAGRVIREYGMSELTGHFYTDVLHGGDGDLFRVPHFMRVRALDPETLGEVAAGRPGLLAVLDLANAGSAMHVLSEDLGVVEDGGFRLLGRAADAELRGCSLTVDELRP